jgi:acid phosphatase type 7
MKFSKLLIKSIFALSFCALGYFFFIKFKENKSYLASSDSIAVAKANPNDTIDNNQDSDPVIAAAGDIACEPSSINKDDTSTCQMKATSDLLVDRGLAAVLTLGDNQYEYGAYPAYQKSYDPTWGRVKSITKPVPGNHEYYNKDAAGYYTYFGAIAGDPKKGYYSYDIGEWHLIALNSNCADVSCGADSPQTQWLKEDLAAHPNACTIAYWHHPRFSSGAHGNNQELDNFWKILYQNNVEIVLNGHDHHYERFAPQSPEGKEDAVKGIRQFVVGTGGKNHYKSDNVQPNSEIRNSETHGVLKLTLRKNSYDWKFEPIAGQTFTDSGSSDCH